MDENLSKLSEEETVPAEPSADIEPEEDNFIIIPDYENQEENEEDYSNKDSIIRERIKASENVEEREKFKREKLPFKKTIPNFFYHYKWVILAVVFLIVVIAYASYSCIMKSYDYNAVIYAVDQEYSVDLLATVSNRLEVYGEDNDGNGKVEIKTQYFDFFTKDYYESIAAQTFHQNDFGKDHNCMIVITDYQSYQHIVNVYDDNGNVIGQKPEFFHDFGDGLRWIPLTGDVTEGFELVGLNNQIGMSLYNIDYYDYMKLREDAEVVQRFENAKILIENYLSSHPEITAQSSQETLDRLADELIAQAASASGSAQAQ
ncbi:MAG: hypothetical protein IJP10_02840 [Clostridia bacterium]|nr:hypothetical protein [Clostridia bacterium]